MMMMPSLISMKIGKGFTAEYCHSVEDCNDDDDDANISANADDDDSDANDADVDEDTERVCS